MELSNIVIVVVSFSVGLGIQQMIQHGILDLIGDLNDMIKLVEFSAKMEEQAKRSKMWRAAMLVNDMEKFLKKIKKAA